MSEIIKKLPTVFQTTPEKKFFDATFDQVFSKKDSEYLAGYLGRRTPGKYRPGKDYYIPEPTKNRTCWQLEPTAYSRDRNYDKTNVVFYEDLLDRIAYYGGNIDNHARLFDGEYYSWAPPIDYDMFINYQNYYWVEDLPAIVLENVKITEIVGREWYLIPGTEIKLESGMVVTFPDDPFGDGSEYYVEISDGVIKLIKKYDVRSVTRERSLPWDGRSTDIYQDVVVNEIWDAKPWDVEYVAVRGGTDVLTIGRGSDDGNIWSRKNRWIHIDTLKTVIDYTGGVWPANAVRGSRPIIQFISNIELFRSGTTHAGDVRWAFISDAFGEDATYTNMHGKTVTDVRTRFKVTVEDGDTMVFTRDSRTRAAWGLPDPSAGTALTSYIFKATVTSSDQVLLTPVGGWDKPVPIDGIIYPLDITPNGAELWESWYFTVSGWERAFNNGARLKTGPWFQLYDTDGVKLDDSVKYPDSSFQGSRIFNYMVNSTPGATVDPVLRFPVVYRSSGQATDIMFENYLITERHVYGAQQTPIDGYYYYRIIGDPIHKNGWELYTRDSRNIDSKSALIPRSSKQRVVDRIALDGKTYVFKLSATPAATLSGGYDITVTINGVVISDANYSVKEVNRALYIDMENYLSTDLWVNQLEYPVLEIALYTLDALADTEYGYFEIPQQLDANPLQEEVSIVSGSEVMEHFASIIASQDNFAGDPYGTSNSYRNGARNRSLGKVILQNTTPALKSMLMVSEPDLDLVTAIRYAQDEYTKFKNRYVSSAAQLIDNEFNPVEYFNNTVLIAQWVDEILKTVNVSKEYSKSFAYSYMVAFGKPTEIEELVPTTSKFALEYHLDMANVANALYVYDKTSNERLLVYGIDYVIADHDNKITVELKNTALVNRRLAFVFYRDMQPSYIPATPAKLGLAHVYKPRIETDYTYADPVDVIIGHDGSRTVVFGDYRDQLLMELEVRIYNSIDEKFRFEYSPPVQLQHVKPGFFRNTEYSFSEYLDITEQALNKWCTRNKANFRVNEWQTFKEGTPSASLWKLYNYSLAEDKNGVPLGLPGHWRGIFEYLYDTVYPDTKPWQMLGFSDMPDWWTTEYGAGVVNTRGQRVWTIPKLWEDLEAGIIRQGPRSVINPYNQAVLHQREWARPGLSKYMPVTAAGELRSVIDIFDINVTNNPYEPFDGYDLEWVYGDGAPVEQAWRATSSYAYSVQELLFLTKPAAYGEYHWDTLGTEVRIGRYGAADSYSHRPLSYFNYQYVQNGRYKFEDNLAAWMRPKNHTQTVHAELVDGAVSYRSGYQQWVSDRILFHGKSIADTFGVKIRNLNVNLANKLAGFTNKDTVNTFIESVSIQSSTRTLGVPSTNFQVMLHRGQPVNNYSYSGVIIRALADGTFAVYGYDLLNSQFVVLDRSDAKQIEVNVGGTPAAYRYFETGAIYNTGDIVRYSSEYYIALYEHQAVKFIPEAWQRLPALPTVGGITVTYRPESVATHRKYAYGSTFKTTQEVFDFLIGWGAYLESQGWQFDQVNADNNQVSDWFYSAKQFLFWLNTNWVPDSTIQLSPLATQASLTVRRGYPNNVELISNGVYSILDKRGVAIPIDQTVTERDEQRITVRPTDVTSGGIYFLQVNSSETEHVLIFDNVTAFNDLIYSPLMRARQDRIRFNGFRTNGWYGKMTAPGYLVIGDRLLPNYDTLVSDMRRYYDPHTTIDNHGLEDLGRRLIGFERKQYLDNLQVSNDVQYLFYQGMIRERGTSKSLDKLFRSSLANTNENIEVFEEWALKIGDVGNVVGHVSTEFILDPEQYTGDTMVARMVFEGSEVGGIQEIKIRNAVTRYGTIPSVNIPDPDMNPYGSMHVVAFLAGVEYDAGAVISRDLGNGNIAYYRCLTTHTPDVFVPENWEQLPSVRPARAHAVLDKSGRLARIDVTDPGFGYSKAPIITIQDSGAAAEDSVYAVWRGETIPDLVKDNIVTIDIDDDEKWVVRPTEPGNALAFPTTPHTEFNLPNAGYVHIRDVDWLAFDIRAMVLNWGVGTFTPNPGDSIWVAKTFTEDWGVYKISPYRGTWSIVKGDGDTLLLVMPLGYWLDVQGSKHAQRTDLGNLISLHRTRDGKSVSDTGFVLAFDPAVIRYTDPVTGIKYNAHQLTTLDDVPLTTAEISEFSEFNTLALFRSLRWSATPGIDRIPIYMTSDDRMWIDDHEGGWAVMTPRFKPGAWDKGRWSPLTKEFYGVDATGNAADDVFGWDASGPIVLHLYRKQEPLIDTSRFKNACVFAGKGGNTLVQLPVYDPFKGILPGYAKQNLSFISHSDPARYNVTNNQRLYTERVEFLDDHVGKLWWDLTNVRYVYYEQPAARSGTETALDNLRYRRDNWGRMFPGSTVDIYEWVKSHVPPVEYTGSGTPRSFTDYTQVSNTNIYTGVVSYSYYFWVKTPTVKPGITNRTLSALEVAVTLQSTREQGYQFFAPIQQTGISNAYMFFNVQDILSSKGRNVRVEYQQSKDDYPVYTQWGVFREGDVTSEVRDSYWARMVDSICGYTHEFTTTRPPKSAISLGDNLYTVPVPDTALSEYERYGVKVRPTQSMFVDIYAARRVFVQSLNDLLRTVPARDKRSGWDAGVELRDYWRYVTWYMPGYENARPNKTANTLTDAYNAIVAGELADGDIVEVVRASRTDGSNRYSLQKVERVDGKQILTEIAIQDSAIQLSDAVYTSRHQYALSLELRMLLTALRDGVFTGEYFVYRNHVFSDMLNFVLSEQRNVDWAFKTSMITIREGTVALTQDRIFVPNQAEDIIEYVMDTKPYHTHVREYKTVYSLADSANMAASALFTPKITLNFAPSGVCKPRVVCEPSGECKPGGECKNGWDMHPWDTHPWDMLAPSGGCETGCDIDVRDCIPCDMLAPSGACVNGWDMHPWDMHPWDGTAFSRDNLWWDDRYQDATGAVGRIQYLVGTNPILLKPASEYMSQGKMVKTLAFLSDPFRVGMASLHAYTFTSIARGQLVAVTSGSKTLLQGQDYFTVENTDGTYTVYFYNPPTAPMSGYIYKEGVQAEGHSDSYRSEVAEGMPTDTALFIVDTIKPAGATAPGLIASYRHGAISDNMLYVRNTSSATATLESDVLSPEAAPYGYTITVLMTPSSQGGYTPPMSGAVWIRGERIEYKSRINAGANKWSLSGLTRGTMDTTANSHAKSQYSKLVNAWYDVVVHFESANIMNSGSETTVWNAADSSAAPDPSTMFEPDKYTSISNPSPYGLWTAGTAQAKFIIDGAGQAIQ